MIETSISMMKAMSISQIARPLVKLKDLSTALKAKEQYQRQIIIQNIDIINNLKKDLESLNSSDINIYKTSIENIKPWISSIGETVFESEEDASISREILVEIKEIMNTADDNMRRDISEKESIKSFIDKANKLLKNMAKDMNKTLFTHKKVDNNIMLISICMQIDQFLISKSADREALFKKNTQEIRSWLYAEGFEINTNM